MKVRLEKLPIMIKLISALIVSLGAGMIVGSTGTYLLLSRELAYKLGLDILILFTMVVDGVATILFGGALYMLVSAAQLAVMIYRQLRVGG